MKYLKLFEEFINKQDILDWLYSNGILNKNEELNKDGVKKLITHFIKNNRQLIEKTALKNCHAIGLNSFILNQNPKIRIFISDEDCEVNKFDSSNPVIPIHPHKYDDLFFPITGKLTHHLYQRNINGIPFNKYNFIRLNTINDEIVKLGEENLKYIDEFSNINKLKSKTLHTISVEGECSWLIIETKQDESFSEIFYHQNLQKRNDLYVPFENPILFLENFINNL